MYKIITFVATLSLVWVYAFSASASVKASTIVELTNKERVKNGLPALRVDQKLMAAASLKAKDMINNNYVGHKDPAGRYSWYLFKMQKYFFKNVAENLAAGWRKSSTGNDILRAWLNSPGHRKNILSTKYKDIGVAVVEKNNKGKVEYIVVQHFGAKQ